VSPDSGQNGRIAIKKSRRKLLAESNQSIRTILGQGLHWRAARAASAPNPTRRERETDAARNRAIKREISQQDKKRSDRY
jgi:hypothetical protein